LTVPSVPLAIDTGERLDLTLTYAPLAAGAASGFLDIDSDDPVLPRITVRITGEAEAPGIIVCAKLADGRLCDDKLAPRNLAIDFGILALTDPPATRTVVLRNASALALNIAQVALAPGTSPEFSVTAFSARSLPPGSETEVTVSYKPIDGGFDTGQLEVSSDDPKKSVVKVDLKGGGKAPKICADPLNVDFGNVVKGTSADRDVTLTSCGVSPLELQALALAPGLSADFALPNLAPVPRTLAPGGKIVVTVRYAPPDLGPDDGKLVVTSDDANNKTGFVRLHGNAVNEPACDLNVSPLTVDFGTVSVTGFSDRLILGVNVGQKACSVSSLAGPTGSPSFTLRSAPGTPLVVKPNDTFSVTVRYKPQAAVADAATLVVNSNDPLKKAITVALKGKGSSPGPCDFQLSPAGVNFGVLPVGGSKAATLTLYNFGTNECFVTDSALAQGSSPAFAVTRSPPFPGNVASNGKVDIEVTFTPRVAGNHAGTLNLKAGPSFFSTSNYAAQLTGSAAAPALCLTPTVLDFGPQAPGNTRDLGFSATSCGAGTIELRGLVFDAGTSPEFSFVNKPSVPLSLPAGNSLQVNVRYAPTTNGPDFGRVLVLSNDPKQPTASVILRGNASGCLSKVLSCAPSSLAFPKTPLGQTSTLTFSCANLGTQDVSLSAVRLKTGTSPEFSLSHRPLPPVLLPGQSVRVAVDYTPTAAGTDSGTVEIVSDDCQRPNQAIALSAEGTVPKYPKCIPPKTFSPVTKWEWTRPVAEPTSKSVWMTPAVANVTDDNRDGRIDEDDSPDVIFVSYDWGVSLLSADPTPPGVLRALDGKTGSELWSVTDPKLRLNAAAQIAVADIDGDNKVEIIASLRVVGPGSGPGNFLGRYATGRLVAFENDGTYKWTSDFWTRDANEVEDGSAISVADLDNDGAPEIVIGASVFSADGRLLWEGSSGRGTAGHGVFSVVADLDGDGRQEVVAGKTAYSATGQVLWTHGATDGLPIVIDVEADGKPEVVLRTDLHSLVVLDGAGNKKYGPHALPNTPQGACLSSISAADFDGDGKPELAVPAGDAIVMMEATGAVKWTHPIDDFSPNGQCGASGAAAFDFEGDGVFEIVYHDSRNVYAFRGTDGTVVFKDGRFSATIFETPVIADVDNDGHADILMTQDAGPGLTLLNNSTNDWVGTRRVWNQYAFHVTNVAEGGAVPRIEPPGWKKVNGYRVNEPRCVP
jgi:hypothetical protein